MSSSEGSFPLPQGTVVPTIRLDLQKLEERIKQIEARISFLGEIAGASDEGGLLAQIAALTQRVAALETRQARGAGGEQRG